ncbi:hypothetical protein KO533_10910 [Shewanella sp. NKUCC05_KAH]|uniref:hypothetical protein n=1 Tax=Shewanella sp. NKUCC05_KAH TaxID=2842126 RepID=UPI001C5B0E4E|nr:hypothetical protein [Shewanella sp. NKUCC05_KAH]MBW3527068.1 hypothetical protein [Shewanella sp. NKUCC05_KAH]
MITDIQVVSAPDLSVENSVMNFRDVIFPVGLSLAGTCWSITGLPQAESLETVLRFVMKEVKRKMSGFSMWLLIGHSAWQPDTRIVRYHKLWGSLKARGVNIPLGEHPQEFLLESDGRLKYFGALRISEVSIESVAQLLLRERCAYLALVPDHTELTQSLKKGWSGELYEDLSLLTCISQSNGLLLKRIGEFDDKEWGILAIGNQSVLSSV